MSIKGFSVNGEVQKYDYNSLDNLPSGGGGTSDYTDLTNKPSINDVTLIGNKTASDLGLGTYSKPGGGIPASDLAPGVIPSVPTKVSDLTNDSVVSYSVIQNMTSTEQWRARRNINAQSTTITDAGGFYTTDTVEDALQEIGSDLASKADRITEVTVSTAGAVTQALDAEKIYHFTGTLTALTITLTAPASGLAHYHFDFDSGSTAPTLTLPNTVTMPSGFTVEASRHYEIDILNGYGAVMAW